jgi:hypothetical protein
VEVVGRREVIVQMSKRLLVEQRRYLAGAGQD